MTGCASYTTNAANAEGLVASPGTVSFGTLSIGQVTSSTVALVNGSAAPIKVTQLSLVGEPFRLAGAKNVPFTIAPGASHTLNVEFRPTAAGTSAGQLTITRSSSNARTMTVALRGTGAITPALSSLTCTTLSMTGAVNDACTVTLTSAAPAAGLNVSVASSNAAVTVPASVTVPANAISATFTAAVSPVTTAQAATLTASGGGVSKALSLQLNASVPTLSLSASSLQFGNLTVNKPGTQSLVLSSTGTAAVTVNSATATGTGFSLSGPAFPITLAPGQTATLSVQFNPTVAGPATGQLTISSNSSSGNTAAVALSGTGTIAPALSSLTCTALSMTGAVNDACTVTLTSAAPAGGLNVSVASSNAAVTVPASVTVPANAISATFTAAVSTVTTAQVATLTASGGGVSKALSLQLNASVPTLSLSTSSLQFGNMTVNKPGTQSLVLSSTGTAAVTVSAAAAAGTGFSLSGAAFPITLAPGQTATLSVQFNPTVAGPATGQLTISSNSSSGNTAAVALSGTGTIAPALSSLTCTALSMTGAVNDACTVTLTSAASADGLSVSVASSNAAVTVPASVTVPANAISATFTAAVSPVTTAQAATLTASGGSVSKALSLQLNASVPTLSLSASSLPFGNVTVNKPGTQSLVLSSTGTAAVTVSAATATGTGFSLSGAAFPVTLAPGQTTTLSVQFNPTVAGPATGQLTISSNSSSGNTAAIALSGTGTPVVNISITPANAAITVASTRQFAAYVTGTSNTAVSWTASGDGCSGTACGTISLSGLYTAPAEIPSPATVTVTGTSEADATKSATSTITIVRSAGTNYYLAPAALGGKDSNDGRSPGAPWLSPNHALNCGDTITAAASSSYDQANFEYGKWGTVTCSSGSGVSVAWLKCATFDACKLSATNQNGMWVTSSYWGVQGWEVTASGNQAICFAAFPPTSSVSIHHIIFANDIANGCYGAGFQPVPNGTAGVDYFVLIGNIAYNAARQTTQCGSGIAITAPTATDSLPGTHIYVAGNFSYGNMDPSTCAGGRPTDGEGIIFDTLDANSYTQQAVMEDNIAFMNGSSGFRVDVTTKAPVFITNNTAYGNNRDPYMNSAECGEVTLQDSTGIQVYNNVARTNSASGCGANPNYSFYVANGDSTDSIYSNFGYAMNGQTSGDGGSPTFSFGSNVFGTDPEFANAPSSNPGPPSCSASINVTDCMAATISGFVPQASSAAGFGYRPPSTIVSGDPLFPKWLCNANVPSGLIPSHC